MRRLFVAILNWFSRLSSKQQKVVLASTPLLFIMTLQMMLPSGYVMPRTYLNGKPVGLHTRHNLKSELAKEAQSVTLALGDHTKEFKSEEVGLSLDTDATLDRLPTFTWGQKLIPLAPFISIIRGNHEEAVVEKDQQKIDAFAIKLSEQEHRPPTNAKAELKDGKLVLSDEVKGLIFKPDQVAQALHEGELITKDPVKVKAEEVPADISKEEFKPLEEQFKTITAKQLKVAYGDTTKEIDTATLSSWLSVIKTSGTWQLAIKPEAINATIKSWAKEYNIPAGITQVSTYDDVETSRKTGAPGRALNETVIRDQFSKWLITPTSDPVVLSSNTVQPQVVVTRTYSRSSEQLQAQINAWIASHNGKYQVAIRELGGKGREASYNVSQQTVMASTYKTFLAYVAYLQSETGAISLGTVICNGKNIEQSIEVMIVNSDNDCAVALGKYIGWAKVDQIIAAGGFQNVKLNNYDASGNIVGDKLVNAKEQAKFLAQLSAGALINGNNTAKLISYMKRQTYRSGIPAGSRGAPVADKVGFLDDYIHDVGIVYGPKSTYALVIMSQGSDWANIRDLAQAVYDFMNG